MCLLIDLSEKHVKRIGVFLVFMLVLSQLFASTYRIRSYKYESDKTTKAALSEFVGPAGTTFESEEAMYEFLADKRQQLYNKRIFYDVLFTYELEQTSPDVSKMEIHFLQVRTSIPTLLAMES